MEVLGGIIIMSLQFLKPATYLYIGTQIWYGSIIPSCYLMNCTDIKVFILEHGWLAGLSKLYSEKQKESNQEVQRKQPENAPEARNSGTNRLEMPTLEEEQNVGKKNKTKAKHTLTKRLKRKVGNVDTCFQENPKEKNRHSEGGNLHHQSGTADSRLSDIRRNAAFNFVLSKRESHKQLNKNTTPSVYYICNNPKITRSVKTDTGSVIMLLPNQVDYS